MSPAKKKTSATKAEGKEMGQAIVEGKLTVAEAAKQYGCGFSTAGAHATAYRRDNKNKPSVKAVDTSNKSIRYETDFKMNAVEEFMKTEGTPQDIGIVAVKLGVSRAGLMKWIEKYGAEYKTGQREKATATEKYGGKDHRTPSQELEIVKDHARDLTLKLAEQVARTGLLQEELEMLKPLARKYLKL